ncbi:hypothetical protein N657DRAFT_610522 [Parathielavia appendiculata]|uniref:Nineteen complex-related protein 2-domain-containing protein n=1 Tax=Parathielavia appendiculata TaxID=2587402 RepID=A0AAN6Z9Q8_9PEZI|nr:hypothetical protein N657DRAFT_610522 [Parathielavia appendiculata]
MSSFGAKRKARVIQTFDNELDGLNPTLNSGGEEQSDRKSAAATGHASLDSPPLLILGSSKSEQADALLAESAPLGRIKFGRNKPAKSSTLRRTININDEDDGQYPAAAARDVDEDDESHAPVVVRPTLGRAGSSKLKKRPAASRLSLGPSEDAADDEDSSAGSAVTKPSTNKKPLGQRLLANNALRKSANLAGSLPMRFGGQEETPRYSKEYLEELQSSTPNTPQDFASLHASGDDEMELDPSELEGAVVVQSTEFISLEGDESDEDAARQHGGGGRMTVNFLSSKKKKEPRLIAEDEYLGEGYDEFVSDGGLALGKKAERDAARRHRQEMAELIQAAEDGSEADSDDSEAERRAAYEAAQRRAGLDGLHRHDEDHEMYGALGPDVIPRMKPLPRLNEVLQRMREILQGLEDQVAQKRARIADLEKEKVEILAREKEVQEILNQAGAKYQAVVASAGGNVGDVTKLASQSPMRPLPPGIAADFPVERGLESFGATPTRGMDTEEMA